MTHSPLLLHAKPWESSLATGRRCKMDNTNNIEVDRPGGKAKTVSNYGYGDAGASWKKRALKSFLANSSSSHEDIDWNNYTLRQRARMLYMAAPLATSAIKTNRTNVIGCGLRLKAKPNAELLGITRSRQTPGKPAQKQSSTSGREKTIM